jgi:hypothetical protein
MKAPVSLFACLCAVALSTAGQAQAPAPAEKKVCKSEAVTGSIMKKKTCRTKAEWDAMTAASRNDLDRLNAMDRSKANVEGSRN